ncbi:hypothetical protein ACQ4WY_05325 [Janthinobacterium sp. LB2P49]
MSKYRHSFPVPVAQLTRQINLAGETQQAPPLPADITGHAHKRAESTYSY